MFDQSFYFGTLRKYVSLFGTLFNDIIIIRQDADGKDQVIRVPIEFAPKEKMLARIEGDPDLDRPYSLLLPRMSFEYGQFMYDGTRKLNTVNKVVAKIEGDNNRLNYQYGPVPYNIPWNLYVYVKHNEDGAKIIEQILPWFTPDFTVTTDIIPEMNEVRDIPVVLQNVSKEDRYEGNFQTRRMQIWTLSFLMKGYFYGPVTKTGIIKVANASFYIIHTNKTEDSIGNTEVAERIIITPGLDANGAPVNYYGTYPANTISIPVANITSNDNYGFIETYESIPIGVARPIGGANSSQTAAQTALEEDEND